MTKVKLSPMARDFRRLRSLAEEILRQCRHYERNTAQGDDDIRALVVQGDVSSMGIIARRMLRRWRRQDAARRRQEA